MIDITDTYIANTISARRLIRKDEVIMTLIELSNVLRELKEYARTENERLRVFLTTMTVYINPNEDRISLYL